jgi:hypothetical protein
MPILRKELVPIGKFLASTPEGGRTWQDFTKEFTTKLVNTTNSMINAGLRIPAPFGHKKLALPEVTKNSTPPPYDNAGYWLSLAIEKNDKNLDALFGYVDVPGSDTEPDTPYYKAKNSAKEVSLSYRDSFQDGLGRIWQNCIMHIALVNHPIVPGQEEFKDVPDNCFVVNMSMAEPDDDDSANSSQLINQLRTALTTSLELNLPSTTNLKQFLRDLLVAVLQLPNKQKEPSLDIAPIYMSHGEEMNLTLQQAEALAKSGTTNPATGKPFTVMDFGFQITAGSVDVKALELSIAEKDKTIATQQTLLKALTDNLKKGVTETVTKRLAALKDKKVISEDQFKAQFEPKIAFEMSLGADGSVAPHPLELTISALEMATGSTGGSTQVVNPRDGGNPDAPVDLNTLFKNLQI